ncbi:alanine and arginine rich protein [Ophiostoma piceae UAMH 11346]|uniref:Alanine and arginine rich protein n=1 Tax=Ophiostoma piceae (strain UAMH 11346) TaxID=1262450 RepID=S3CTH9_OPHP1|nr:alanine and arginine rich protein [Ophiostoma piceae UAMH 11346]
MTAGKDTVVHPSAPMPKGYTFVSKGNVYITAHCRSATYAANKPLYVVSKKAGTARSASKGGVLGLRCPIHIAKAVREDERASRSTRHEATAKRDDTLANTFRDALLAAYPDTPRDMVPQVVKHAMTKRQGRVARTGTLKLDQRVRLAVRAHIRHCHTNYDALLRGTDKDKQPKLKKGQPQAGVSREEARRLTLGQVDRIEHVWAAKAPKPNAQKPEAQKPSGTSVKAGLLARKARRETTVPKKSTANRVQKQTATATPSPTRPTRLSKSAAASRIAQCLRSPRGGRGHGTPDVIVIDSSDEDIDGGVDISSDESEVVSSDSDEYISI